MGFIMEELRQKLHEADICVVGGGIGGMFTAISAARHGASVVLMHDRPVLGGNASSEIRMWISGAGTRVRNLQETGLLEELELDNMFGNPDRTWPLWDALLYEKVRFEPNIDLILNCACSSVSVSEKDGKRLIGSVSGFQTTTYTVHTVKAKIFCDCSGDSILAPLSGADYRVGREAASEYGEEFGLPEADSRTMGMSLMLQCRETDHKVKFTPPSWAYVFETDADMKNKPHDCLNKPNTNFYWIELGGMADSIHDTEEIRDELLKIAYGVWDHMKNRGDHGADNWELEWLGFLPGKRESRRYLGDYVLTQDDVEHPKRFEDTVAYGGWQIDNHLPGGFFADGGSDQGGHLQKRRLSEPYNIPFRCLYSRNVDNLMFAGRNISATHIAFASSRVMGTVGVLGQACGTAAATAVKKCMLPREVCSCAIGEIQDALLEDDCFLPGFTRKNYPLTEKATLSCDYGDCSALRSGLDRRIWGCDNGYFGKTGKAVTYEFPEPVYVSGFRLVADADLDREQIDGNPDLMHIPMPLFRAIAYDHTSFGFPKCLLKSFRIEAKTGGEWKTVYSEDRNHQRLIKQELGITCTAVRLIPESTWGSDALINTYGSAVAHIFSFDLY